MLLLYCLKYTVVCRVKSEVNQSKTNPQNKWAALRDIYSRGSIIKISVQGRVYNWNRRLQFCQL